MPKIRKALVEQINQFINSGFDYMAVSQEPIRAVLTPLYLDAGVKFGWMVYRDLPKAPKKTKSRTPFGFEREMIDLINSYFESEILNTSLGITETTRDVIRVIMEIAIEEGRGLDWITDNLVAETRDINYNRARLIARTETVTATNQAAFLAAAKTGLLMTKEWLSANDNRVRTDHEIVNGNTIGFEDYFTVGSDRMLVPGAKVQENGLPTSAKEVCNCRCVCLYTPYRRMDGRLQEWDYGYWIGNTLNT